MSAPQRVILWFRNDLRVTDNYILVEAARKLAAKKCSEILPVYCLDPRHFGTTRYSAMKQGPFRAQFLLESVSDLKRQLQSVGSDLLLFHDEPERVLPRLMAAGASTEVLAQQEVCSEELRVDRRVLRAIKPLGGTLELIWGATMYHKDDLPFDPQLASMPDVFTPFKEKCYGPHRPDSSPYPVFPA
jgi:deoxyribodipyrimidine photo-lyase